MTLSPKIGTALLIDMLAYCRPANTATETQFIARYIVPTGALPDAFGNYISRIGTAPVLWSCHTDTVHRVEGMQSVSVEKGIATLAAGSKSNCLGADCTTGVWLMVNMIQRGVEGLYVFHRQEESGGFGSAYIAEKTPELLTGIDFAIALDRFGGDSIITHQAGGRSASDAFAASIAKQLPDGYFADAGGTFTDTANYTRIVPDCTNLSVGYLNQHSSAESQCLLTAERLLAAMLALDVSQLVAERMPDDDDDWKDKDYGLLAYFDDWKESPAPRTVEQVVRACPELVAELLESMGYDPAGLVADFCQTRRDSRY